MVVSNQILIPAIVSGVVAIVVATVSAIMNARSQNVEQRKQQAQLQREMTKLVYERRLQVYPKYMHLTDPLLRRNIYAASDKKAHLISAIEKLDELQSTEAGFLISNQTLRSYRELRRTIRVDIDAVGSKGDFTAEQIGRIHKARIEFRKSLRLDMRLIYAEDFDQLPERQRRDTGSATGP